MPRGLGYVMHSRAESLEDVYIAGSFDPEKIKYVEIALKEAERVEKISLTNDQDHYDCSRRNLGFAFLNVQSLQKHLMI